MIRDLVSDRERSSDQGDGVILSLEQRLVDRWGERAALVVAVAAALVLVVGGTVAIGSDALTIGAGALVVAVVGHRSPVRTVVLWAALIRIDHLGSLATRIPDGWHLASLAYVAYRVSVSRHRVRAVAPWVALAGAAFALRIGFALLDGDRSSLSIALTVMGLLVTATIAVVGHRATVPVLVGLAIGATASASVAVIQLTGLARLTTARDIDLRHPGLAASTTGTSWHLAIGLIALLAVRGRAPGRWRLAVDVAIAVTAVGLVGCGSQGGLIGLGLTGIVLAVKRGWSPRSNPRVALGLAALAAVAVVLAATSAIDGFPPEKGFANDLARFDIAGTAIEEIRGDPWSGPGTQQFLDAHGIQPHLLPLQLGVGAGIVGMIIGTVLVVGLAVRAVRAWGTPGRVGLIGAALLTTVLPWSLVEPAGPLGSDLGLVALLLGIIATDQGVFGTEGDTLAATDAASGSASAWERSRDSSAVDR